MCLTRDMSAPLTKFQDHYAILGIETNADTDRMVAAYARASEKYHPNNPETGDAEKYEAITAAFEVLSDSVQRREFDKVKGLDKDGGDPKFTGLPFFEALGRGSQLRVAMLCVLYDRRRSKPFRPSLSMRQFENSLCASEEELLFALWYLKQRGLVGQDDKSSLLITVEGMDFLESNQPVPEVVMPFIKMPEPAAGAPAESADMAPEITTPEALAAFASALEASPPVAAAAEEPVAPNSQESVRNLMRRLVRV